MKRGWCYGTAKPQSARDRADFYRAVQHTCTIRTKIRWEQLTVHYYYHMLIMTARAGKGISLLG
jgi:hypothetical protein